MIFFLNFSYLRFIYFSRFYTYLKFAHCESIQKVLQKVRNSLENFEIFKKKQHSEIYVKTEIKKDCTYSQRGQKPYPLVVACNDFPEKVCVCVAICITFPNDITFMSRHGRLINFNGKFGFFSR